MTSDQFDNQKYVNLETFRTNGEGVKTPVWFVHEADTIYIWTEAESWKVKRIRRNRNIRITPCKSMGEPTGTWVHASAETNESPEAQQSVRKLMRKKYGLAFRFFELAGKLKKTQYTTLQIKIISRE
jgi:uncharacterized protein